MLCLVWLPCSQTRHGAEQTRSGQVGTRQAGPPTSLGQVRLLGEAHQCWADLHERMQAGDR